MWEREVRPGTSDLWEYFALSGGARKVHRGSVGVGWKRSVVLVCGYKWQKCAIMNRGCTGTCVLSDLIVHLHEGGEGLIQTRAVPVHFQPQCCLSLWIWIQLFEPLLGSFMRLGFKLSDSRRIMPPIFSPYEVGLDVCSNSSSTSSPLFFVGFPLVQRLVKLRTKIRKWNETWQRTKEVTPHSEPTEMSLF